MAATGSADAAAYVFDAGGNRGEQGDFIQKLDGHKNRVYSATFHPTQVRFFRPSFFRRWDVIVASYVVCLKRTALPR